MRKPLIAGNWKMNLTPTEALEMVRKLQKMGEVPDELEAVLIPAFPALYPLQEELKNTKYSLGAQNMSAEDPGAYTGEVSWNMLVDLGVKYVLVGHSERRKYYHEDGTILVIKIKKALEIGLLPIFCVGESLEERKQGLAERTIEEQLQEVLAELSKEDMRQIVIAYEPVWAIGTGVSATAEDAQKMSHIIRTWLESTFDKETAETVRILYGGSVKPENIQEIMREEDIDGALVGGASLKATDFYELLLKGK